MSNLIFHDPLPFNALDVKEGGILQVSVPIEEQLLHFGKGTELRIKKKVMKRAREIKTKVKKREFF